MREPVRRDAPRSWDKARPVALLMALIVIAPAACGDQGGGDAVSESPYMDPVEWMIELDDPALGVHTVHTIVEVHHVAAEDVAELRGWLVWENATVELCGIAIRSWGQMQATGDDASAVPLRIGDIFQTTEGCGAYPSAMQDAFDELGPPATACLSVGTREPATYDTCAPIATNPAVMKQITEMPPPLGTAPVTQTPLAASKHYSSERPFDFETDSICSLFTPEEINTVVADAYETQGIEAPGGQAGWHGCIETGGGSLTWLELPAIARSPASHPFDSVEGLPSEVRVRSISRGCVAYIPGFEAEVLVSDHDEVLRFGHFLPRDFQTPGGCDPQVVNPVGFAILTDVLRQMGWI